MKKAFQKTLVAGSIGLLAATSAFAGTPGTSNLLFPFISTVDTAQTFLSIIARDTTAALPVGTAAPVHITYVTRTLASATCSHYDGDMAMTANDQMTFEVSNRTDVNGLTGDTTSTPVQLPANANNRIGFAIVNNQAGGAYGTGAVYGSYPLYGEARIIDTATGLFLGYSTDDLHTTGAATPDFAVATGYGPDASPLDPVLAAAALYPNKIVNWFSTGAVDTTWVTLPLADESVMGFLNTASITYQVRNSNGLTGGHYNNNEVFRSSTASHTATCLGSVTRAALLDPIVATHSANGGWGTFIRTAGTAANALVYKNETLMPGAFGGKGNFVTRVPVL